MFCLIIHFPYETLKYKFAMSSTDILNLDTLMVAHGFSKTMSKITIDKGNPIATLVYDVWFEKE